jgi:hypothetical protein
LGVLPGAALARPWAPRHLGVLPGSAMYTPVHKHFEPILNAVSCRLRIFYFNKLSGALAARVSHCSQKQ